MIPGRAEHDRPRLGRAEPAVQKQAETEDRPGGWVRHRPQHAGSGWPPAIIVATATVTMSCPVILGWTSRLPQSARQDQDLAAASDLGDAAAGHATAGDLAGPATTLASRIRTEVILRHAMSPAIS